MRSFADIVKQSHKKDEIEKKDKIVILKKEKPKELKIKDVSYSKNSIIEKIDDFEDDGFNMNDYIDSDGYNHYLKCYEK